MSKVENFFESIRKCCMLNNSLVLNYIWHLFYIFVQLAPPSALKNNLRLHYYIFYHFVHAFLIGSVVINFTQNFSQLNLSQSFICTHDCTASLDYTCDRCTPSHCPAVLFHSMHKNRYCSSSIVRHPQHFYSYCTSLNTTAYRGHQYKWKPLPTLLICKNTSLAFHCIGLLLLQCHAISVFYPLRRFCFDISTSPIAKWSS